MITICYIVGKCWFIFFFFFKNVSWPHQTAHRILVHLPEIELTPPALEAQSLNHWTNREVPIFYIEQLV